MIQAEQHALFVQIAFAYGWTLWEYGSDTSCEAENPGRTPIWMKPVAYDPEQMVPVGCLCCTNLDDALVEWHDELKSFCASEIQRVLGSSYYFPPGVAARSEEPLASAPDWLPVNRPR